VPRATFDRAGEPSGPQVASPAMTQAAVGGLESAAEPRGQERVTFPAFDGFRALAAITVLITHVAFLSGFNGRSRLGAFTARMDVGVAVFFMISGFLLYRPFVAARLANRSRPGALPYFWRRALRIFPAYWVALTISIFVLHVPKHIPAAKDLVLYYGLFHLYSLGNVVGPILSSYTLVTEISFYVFLPVYALLMSRWARSTPQRLVRIDLCALAGLVIAGVAYRWAIRATFDGNRAFQLLNILPGWIDVFAVGMALAVISAWFATRREPTLFRRRLFPGVAWALAAAAFVAISLWMGRPGTVDTLWKDMGVHYFYLAIGLFFLLPGIFGPQRQGLIRRLLRIRAVQLLGLVSYGLYLWNETLLEKYVEWTNSTAFNTSFPKMLVVVFAVTVLVSAASYIIVERPVLTLKSRVPSRRPAATPAG
jgi:peptidoglycan/LPS O-acetylase OafA/YrhL